MRFFQGNMKDPKIHGIKIKKKNNYTIATTIMNNNLITTNSFLVSNTFNKYFIRVAIDIPPTTRFFRDKYLQGIS